MTTLTIERTTQETTPRTTTPRTKRAPQRTLCPSCGHVGQSSASTIKCDCGLVAPRKAFQNSNDSARTWGAPRAYTIRGRVD